MVYHQYFHSSIVDSTFPEIGFACPQQWTQLRGDERSRHCGTCDRQVHNLSMMTEPERRALLSTPGDLPCVAYFHYLDETPIDVTALPSGDPIKSALSKAAAVSLGTMSLLSGCAVKKQDPVLMRVGMICPPAEVLKPTPKEDPSRSKPSNAAQEGTTKD